MNNYFKFFTAFFFLIFSVQLSFATKGKISGYIFDKMTHQPIPDANIIVSNTNFGAASKDGGFYFIENLPQGKYDIIVKVIGYQTETKENVTITENTVVSFALTPRVIELDPIIVTATLSDHLQSQVTIAAEVLTLPRLNERAGGTVGETMESTGGVHFNSYDGMAGTQIASIRGSNVDQVVVLLDGLRLNTAQGGGVDLNLIPVSVLERIEVVRGGHSTLLGSDAIGGAIQLISRESLGLKDCSYGVNSTLGSFGTKTLNLFGSHKISRLSYFVNYNRIQTDGDFTFKTPNTGIKAIRDNNDYQGDNTFIKTNFELSLKNKLQAIVHHLHTRKGNAGSLTINPVTNQPLLTPNARAEMDRKLFAIKSENQVTDRFRLEGQTYYQTYDYHYKDPDGWLPTDDAHENSAVGANLQGQFHFNKNIDLIEGIEIRQDRLISTKFKVDDRNTQSLYGLTEIRFPMSLFGLRTLWTTTPAIRWDNYSDIDTQLSPKLGLLITTGEGFNFGLRGNVGKSYRVPTFDDLYWPDEIWAKGNPNLTSETSTSFDLGLFLIKKSSSFVQVEIDYFHSIIDDLISWGADSAGVWMPLNIGKANIKGLETGVKFNLPSNIAHLDIFHSWINARDETPNSATTGKRLIYRPDSQLDILIGSYINKFSANLNYRLVSKRYISTDNLRSLSDYQVLKGNVGYTGSFSGFTITARLEILNILDKSIYVYEGYPLPGREFRFSLGINY